ncbi:MAG: ATP-binding cassette domain-containing protein [Clostridia bacterium]|nr:ATP-binding cassette domain-containing protein [Clostridia bacterium]
MENNNNFPEKAEDFIEEAPFEFEDLTAQAEPSAAKTDIPSTPDINTAVIPDTVRHTAPAPKHTGKPVNGDSIISVRNLSKSYGSKKVLDGVSFDLERGHIIGLLGPNGSGKTSLIKIFTGLINDYTGDVFIDGCRPGVITKAKVAYLPEKTYLASYMTVDDSINYIADFYDDFDKKKAMKMVDVFQLPHKQKVRTMSKGQQEKIQLLLVMCRNAEIYILDEPMGGVDPAARDFILQAILQNRPEGSTILMSTHLIHDIEPVLDSIIMIGHGALLKQDTTANLTAKGQTINEIFKEVFRNDWEF